MPRRILGSEVTKSPLLMSVMGPAGASGLGLRTAAEKTSADRCWPAKMGWGLVAF